METLHMCSTFLSNETLPTAPTVLFPMPEHALGLPRCGCLILRNEFRVRSMMEMYDRQIINSGKSQASTIKIITYERSLHDVEKLSNEHPIKYD